VLVQHLAVAAVDDRLTREQRADPSRLVLIRHLAVEVAAWMLPERSHSNGESHRSSSLLGRNLADWVNSSVRAGTC
jgi:hypothetical protein